MSLPISSLDVAAEATLIRSLKPFLTSISLIINSDIADLQMLPWQINKTFIIRRFLSLRIVHAEHIEYTISDCEDIGFDIID